MQDISLLHGLVPETLVQIDKLLSERGQFCATPISSIFTIHSKASNLFAHACATKNDYEIKKV